MTLDAFLESAWNDHADRPQEVADRVAASFHLVRVPEHFAPFARLLVHVYGEHLGQWQQGVELLESLRQLPSFDNGGIAASSIARGMATLRYAGGAAQDLTTLSVDDRVCALATASSALAARHEISRAIAAFTEAIESAQPSLPSGSPGIRALAVGGNNLAATLEEKSDRSASETAAMVAAAEAGLQYWKLAGTWLEEERADYRLARSLLEAGQPLAAIQSAKRCLEVCEQHDAPPFERFFAHAVVGLAHRAAGDVTSFETHRQRAKNYLDQLPEEERKWCEDELAELGRTA
jgi:tetratricopeptide (TPR) repeat protein